MYMAHLGVQYKIYPAHFPFDLRCQSHIIMYRYFHINFSYQSMVSIVYGLRI